MSHGAGRRTRGSKRGRRRRPPRRHLKTEPAPRAPAIAEAEVRALIARWHEAQNAGDFAAYEALYAERFQGIKRVGASTHRFDRERWMRDRQRMFAAPMKVEIADLVISVANQVAIAGFTQHWSSARFSDRGPKQLIVVREGDLLRISSEQMMASAVEHGASADVALADFMQVVHTRHHYVVLSAQVADDWARGEAQFDSGKHRESSARKAAIAQSIPQAARDVLGTKVAAYDARGIACRAKVGTPFVWRRVVRHFGVDDEESEAQLSEAAKADSIWSEARERSLLVAELTDPEGDCTRGALGTRRRSTGTRDLRSRGRVTGVDSANRTASPRTAGVSRS